MYKDNYKIEGFLIIMKKILVSDSRVFRIFSDGEHLKEQLNKEGVVTEANTGSELADLKLKSLDLSKFDIVIVLLGVNDMAMRPFNRRMFRILNKKRKGFFWLIYSKIIHFFNKYVFYYQLKFVYNLFGQKIDVDFVNRYTSELNFLLSRINKKAKIVYLENIIRQGVFDNYIPGYDKRVSLLNNRIVNLNEARIIFHSSPLLKNDLYDDGIHFNQSGHDKIANYILSL